MAEKEIMKKEELEKVAGGQLGLCKEKIMVDKNDWRYGGSCSVKKCVRCGKEFTVYHPDAGKLTWEQQHFCKNCVDEWSKPLKSQNESS